MPPIRAALTIAPQSPIDFVGTPFLNPTKSDRLYGDPVFRLVLTFNIAFVIISLPTEIRGYLIVERFSRTELLFGQEAMQRIASARVAVFGIGGVGGYVVEALARSGVGQLDIIDNDKVCLSNINRQIYATERTVGRYKVDVAAERIAEINPKCEVRTFKTFFMPDNSKEFDFTLYDYVVDAIDTVTGKIEIIMKAQESNIPIISCMGTGNKLDPTKLEISDIYKTSVCPLARVMRSELKKRGVKSLKVLFSKENPLKPLKNQEKNGNLRKAVPGSTAFVPPSAGLIIASEVIRDILANAEEKEN